MESNGLSASDIALLGNDNGFGGSTAFLWIFALLILAGGGFGGFGGNNAAAVTTEDMQRAIDLNSIQQGQADIEARVQEVGSENISALKDASYNNLGEVRDLQASVANGFSNVAKTSCETLRAIDGVNYNQAINTASINANTTEQTQKVLDALSTNRMADMQNQINNLQLQNAMAGVVRYPNQTTYSIGMNPYCNCNSITTI